MITARTRQVRLTVTMLACDDLNNMCRTVDYAAKQIGVQVTSIHCEPEQAHFEAWLEGGAGDIATLQSILREGFPEAEVEFEEDDD